MKDLSDLSIFGINEKQIPDEVLSIANNLSPLEKAAYTNQYKSWRNFVIVLYHLRFVRKMMNAQIAQELGVASQNIHNNLYKFNWEYYPDFDQNNVIAKKKMESLRSKFYEAKNKSAKFDFSNNELVKNALQIHLRPYAYTKFGFSTFSEYVKTMYLLHFEENLPPRELCKIFHESINVTAQRLQTLGFNKSHKMGIQVKKENQTQDYKKSRLHANITRLQSQMDTGSFGSANENKLRTQLSFRLPELITDSKFDIVVGLPNIGNLGSLETDIPIMIYDNNDQKFFRFVVEWNGLHVHTELRDLEKKIIATQKGWHYIPVYDESDGKYSNIFEQLDQIAIVVCHEIIGFINKSA